jgi:hypothetical protein
LVLDTSKKSNINSDANERSPLMIQLSWLDDHLVLDF